MGRSWDSYMRRKIRKLKAAKPQTPQKKKKKPRKKRKNKNDDRPLETPTGYVQRRKRRKDEPWLYKLARVMNPKVRPWDSSRSQRRLSEKAPSGFLGTHAGLLVLAALLTLLALKVEVFRTSSGETSHDLEDPLLQG